MKEILTFPLNVFGCGYYRLFIPFKKLQEKYNNYHVQAMFSESMNSITQGESILFKQKVENKQVIVIQRRYGFDWENFAKDLKHQGKTVIYEIDDCFEGIPLENLKLNAIHMTHPETKKSVLNMIKIADYVTVSTPELKKWVVSKTYNSSKVYYLKNTLDFSMFPEPHFGQQEELGQPPVIGFAGSESHKSDLRELGGALEMINSAYNTLDHQKVLFGFFGFMLRDFWSMHPNTKFKTGVPFLDYYKTLSDLKFSIGLAPLKKCLFNECKSELRFIEHAACGIPIVGTDIAPFRRCVNKDRGILVENKSRKWVSALKKLINNKELRYKLGKNSYDYVKEHYNIDTYIEEWNKLYINL